MTPIVIWWDTSVTRRPAVSLLLMVNSIWGVLLTLSLETIVYEESTEGSRRLVYSYDTISLSNGADIVCKYQDSPA